MYLHRYLRLTPVLAIAILFFMRILPILGSGPLHKGLSESSVAVCEENWFFTLLYVQNYATSNMVTDQMLYIIYMCICVRLTSSSGLS